MAYLEGFWMSSRDFWGSWSRKGRRFASLLLNVAEGAVIPTTNHLEAFNFVLKHKYTGAFTRNGHRLRFDVFIFLLVKQILPQIYMQHHLRRRYASWLSQRFREASGGADLNPILSIPASQTTPKLLWWSVDDKRQEEALAMSKVRRIRIYDIDGPTCQGATCASTAADISDPGHLRYQLVLCHNGYGSCECPDFTFRGGACKHLRLFRLYVDAKISATRSPAFYYPSSPLDARAITIPDSVRGQLSVSTTLGALSALHCLSRALPGQESRELCDADDDEDRTDDEPEGECEGSSEDEGEDDDEDDEDDEDDGGGGDRFQPGLVRSNALYWWTLLTVPYNLLKSSYSALQTQSQTKIEHSIKQMLPALYGLRTDLDATPFIDRTSVVGEFAALLDSMTTQLHSISTLSDTGPSDTHPSYPTPQPSAVGVSRSRGETREQSRERLLPPSPERASKRKKSHSTF